MAQLAAIEPDVREFEATVESVDGRTVVLGRSYFYAESGGQPADGGTLAGVRVESVRKDDGVVVHELAEEPDLAAGDTAVGVVDDGFRTYTMRAHTASHVLYGAGRLLLDDFGYAGFDIGEEKVRIDFETTTEVDDDTLAELERLANRAVWESRPVAWEEVPVDEADEREAVAFNTKTEEGVMADDEMVRIVTVGPTNGGEDGWRESHGGESDTDADAGGDPEDGSEPRSAGSTAELWDVAACGGTHVSNTREIGPVELLDRSNPGEGVTRVEFAVGPAAVERRAAVRRAADATARALGTNVDGMPEEARRLREERDELEAELSELKAELLERRIERLEQFDCDGRTWAVGAVDGFGPNDVKDRLGEHAGEDGVADVLVVAGEQGSTFVVSAVAEGATGGEDGVDAGDVIDEVTDEFGGGGGGAPTLAQGGGLDADPEDVVAYLRSE
jgi:alanyl-tRNA synthetase